MGPTDIVLERMVTRIHDWRAVRDDKALFLDCYHRMTRNMVVAIEEDAFEDAAWVGDLLDRFAGYYFEALEAYERDPAGAPRVWRLAHDGAGSARATAMQKLLLGVNAHINYDLVLTLIDLLDPSWARLSDAERRARYEDHCRVNAVIASTIDEVQDEVIDPAMPHMDLLDFLLGPADEWLISHLITRWREGVWLNATGILAVSDPAERDRRVRNVEAKTLEVADLIGA